MLKAGPQYQPPLPSWGRLSGQEVVLAPSRVLPGPGCSQLSSRLSLGQYEVCVPTVELSLGSLPGTCGTHKRAWPIKCFACYTMPACGWPKTPLLMVLVRVPLGLGLLVLASSGLVTF